MAAENKLKNADPITIDDLPRELQDAILSAYLGMGTFLRDDLEYLKNQEWKDQNYENYLMKHVKHLEVLGKFIKVEDTYTTRRIQELIKEKKA